MSRMLDAILGKGGQGATLAEQLLMRSIGGLPNGGQSDADKYATPGFAGPLQPPPPTTGSPPPPPPKTGFKGGLERLGGFLNSDGGHFVMNLLAQQGYGPMPVSKLGVLGRAGIATQRQRAEGEKSEQERLLIESVIGLNKAKTESEGVGGPSSPESAIAKINTDERSGLITADQAANQRAKIMREGQSNVLTDVNTLRGQYRTDISGPRASLSGLAAAEGLLSVNNAIGDTAAFTSFIRSIDNSVVRPAEQDAYNKALGVRNQIQATVQQWAGKGPLPPPTKRALLSSIRELRDIMEGITDRTTEYYSGEATKAGLDVESVTGLPVKFEQREVSIPGDNGGVEQPAAPLTQAAIDFGVTPEEWAVMPPAARRDFED